MKSKHGVACRALWKQREWPKLPKQLLQRHLGWDGFCVHSWDDMSDKLCLSAFVFMIHVKSFKAHIKYICINCRSCFMTARTILEFLGFPYSRFDFAHWLLFVEEVLVVSICLCPKESCFWRCQTLPVKPRPSMWEYTPCVVKGKPWQPNYISVIFNRQRFSVRNPLCPRFDEKCSWLYVFYRW